MMNHRTPLSSRTAKVRWLQAHRLLCVLPDDRQSRRAIIKLMKADGLISHTTSPFDINLPSLIAEAHSLSPLVAPNGHPLLIGYVRGIG